MRPYLIALTLAVCLYTLHVLNLFNFHEASAVDFRFKLRGEQPADPRIVIVEIDDTSLRAVGQWPWPRGIDAALLTSLSSYHPRLIFLDILFTEPSPDAAEDAKLAEAVKKAGNVLVPFYFYNQDPFQAFFPMPALRQNAQAEGYVNIDPEKDGVIRKFRPYLKTTDKTYYSIAAALALELKAIQTSDLSKLVSDPKRRMWIRYPGTIRSFRRIAAWQILAAADEKNDELEKLFANNIIFVGHTATGTTDLKPVPFSPLEPGVAIHASSLDTLLHPPYLRSAPIWLDFLTLAALLLLAAHISQSGSPGRNLLIVLGLVVIYFILNFLSFAAGNLIFTLYLPAAGMILVYLIILFLKYMDARFQGELLNRELQTAARIQENFLPRSQPNIAGIDIAFECRFAKQVGGDLYDWRKIGENRLAVCVGDVSGKGCPAALYMARALNELRHAYEDGRTPGQLNQTLNAMLSEGENSGMFLTLFYAVIDMEKKKIFFSNAGHEPLIYYSSATKKSRLDAKAQGMPLGLFGEAAYETGEISYQKGDVFIVISDGVKEARNPKKEEFGTERLKNLMERESSRDANAKSILAKIFESLDEHRRGASPHDDQTIFCVRFD